MAALDEKMAATKAAMTASKEGKDGPAGDPAAHQENTTLLEQLKLAQTSSTTAFENAATSSSSSTQLASYPSTTSYHWKNDGNVAEQVDMLPASHPAPKKTPADDNLVFTIQQGGITVRRTSGRPVASFITPGGDLFVPQSISSEDSIARINELALKASKLTFLEEICRPSHPYTDDEMSVLHRPKAPLIYGLARYVPQWDKQLLGDKAPETAVDYGNPPEKLDLTMIGALVCEGECRGLTWLSNTTTKGQRIVREHPHHPCRLTSDVSLGSSSIIVNIASVYGTITVAPYTAPVTGIGVCFSNKSKFNIDYLADPDELFWPLVNGKAACSPPPGHRPHNVVIDQEVGAFIAALCALRIIERRIHPQRLQELCRGFYGDDSSRPPSMNNLQLCQPFRVILATHSKFLVNTMCGDIRRYRKVARADLDYANVEDKAVHKALRKAALARVPCGDDVVYLRKDGKVVHNSMAITALEWQTDLLARFGIQVQYLLITKEANTEALTLARGALDLTDCDGTEDFLCKIGQRFLDLKRAEENLLSQQQGGNKEDSGKKESGKENSSTEASGNEDPGNEVTGKVVTSKEIAIEEIKKVTLKGVTIKEATSKEVTGKDVTGEEITDAADPDEEDSDEEDTADTGSGGKKKAAHKKRSSKKKDSSKKRK